MEFTQGQIARLVLGYLKAEKCHTAFEAFLETSPYLKDYVQTVRRGKYFITRVAGLSLIDYLTEYALIYTLVQERLEASEYYDKIHLSNSLIQQILYLLDNNVEFRTASPILQNRENTSHGERNHAKTKSSNKCNDCAGQIHNSIGNSDNSSMEISNTMELTPNASSHMLTDIQCTSTTIKTPKHISQEKCDKSSMSMDQCDGSNKQEKAIDLLDFSVELLTQTLLGNHELHEKLAENINKEVSVLSSSTEERHNSTVSHELNAAIKTIVERTEADPIFDQLVGEIIVSADEILEENSKFTPNKTQNESIHQNLSPEQQVLSNTSTPKKLVDLNNCEEFIKRKTRKLKNSNNINKDPIIEEQNNHAVESIIAASKTSEPNNENQEVQETVDRSFSANTSSSKIATSVGEIMVFEGNLDTYMKTSTNSVQSLSNQMVINTGGLLMMRPNSVPPAMATNTFVNTTKPCYVINGQQLLNVNIPQPHFKLGNGLSEQDILTMPTVILSDTNQQLSNPPTLIPSYTSEQKMKPCFVNIAPKPLSVDKVQSASEFITLYQCNDSYEDTPTTFHDDNSVSKKNKLKKQKKSSVSNNTVSENKSAINSKSECVVIASSEECKAPSKVVQAPETSKSSQNVGSMPQLKTPLTKEEEKVRNTTPKSGSHVRQLDFSTPEKYFPLSRKANTSSKVSKLAAENKTPFKEQHETTKKNVKTSLFKTPEAEIQFNSESSNKLTNEADESKENNSSKNVSETTKPKTCYVSESQKISKSKKAVKNVSSWDADLRTLANSSLTHSSPKLNRKRLSKTCLKSAKKIDDTNTVYQNEAKQIEAALIKLDCISPEIPEIKNLHTDVEIKTPTIKKCSDHKTLKKSVSCKVKKETAVKSQDIQVKSESLERVESNLANEQDVTLPKQRKLSTGDHTTENVSSKMQYVVINRHVKPRIKKKCNIDNTAKKSQTTEEIVVTNITKIKTIEVIDEGKSKLVLSPSKLNANKRSLVEIENKNSTLDNNKNSNKSNIADEHTDASTSKFITPENVTVQTNNSIMYAKRNITPILETPIKYDIQSYPKTPRFLSPINTTDTPFTKVLKEQLSGVDISTIPTPKFPITPNFPFTPKGNEQSPYSNRPTDYSTSSSYYQPSDHEQNKSLEQLIIDECRRLENKVPTPIKNSDFITEENAVLPQSTMQDLPCTVSLEKIPMSCSQLLSQKAIADKVESFNRNVIGKKNLSLMKTNMNTDSNTSSDSSSSDSANTSSSDCDSDSSNASWTGSHTNDTVIQNNISADNSITRYALRPRRTNLNQSSKLNVTTPKMVKESPAKRGKQVDNRVAKKPLGFQDKILQDMEQKRQRMIAKCRDDNAVNITVQNNSKQKESLKVNKKSKINDFSKGSISLQPRNAKGKFKPLPAVNSRIVKNKSNKKANGKCAKDNVNIHVNTERSRRKSSSPKKGNFEAVNNITQETNISQCIANIETKYKQKELKTATVTSYADQIVLHLSSDEDTLKPFELVETELLESSLSPVTVQENKESQKVIILENRLLSVGSTNNNAKSNDENKTKLDSVYDQEAETLVKGLKQWGIHLIPNKSPKKSTTNNCTSIDVTQLSSKQSRSLGSDDNAKDKCILKKSQTKSIQNIVNISPATNSNKGKLLPFSNKLPPIKCKEVQSSKAPICNREKNLKESLKSVEAHTNIKVQHPCTTTEINETEEFDFKTYEGETVTLVFNENNKCKRTLKDYNFALLDKDLSVKVYCEEADNEMEKHMKCTNFEFLLDISPKINVLVPKRKPNSSRHETTTETSHFVTKKSVHKSLYNVVKDSIQIQHSPLDDLYSTETKRTYNIHPNTYHTQPKRNCSENQKFKSVDDKSTKKTPNKKKSNVGVLARTKSHLENIVDKGKSNLGVDECDKSNENCGIGKTDSLRLQHYSKTKHESQGETKEDVSEIDSKIRDTKQNKSNYKSEKFDNSKQCESSSKEKFKNALITDTESEEREKQQLLKLISNSRNIDPNKLSDESTQQSTRSPNKCKSLELVVSFNNATTSSDIATIIDSDVRESEENIEEKDPNDDLMNYAIVGSERTENDDQVVDSSSKKRKAIDDFEKQEKKPRTDCHELLKKIDVDSFLKKLHGEV